MEKTYENSWLCQKDISKYLTYEEIVILEVVFPGAYEASTIDHLEVRLILHQYAIFAKSLSADRELNLETE